MSDALPNMDSSMMACPHCGHWHDSWECPVQKRRDEADKTTEHIVSTERK